MDEPVRSRHRPARVRGLTSPHPVTAPSRPSATGNPPPPAPDQGTRTSRRTSQRQDKHDRVNDTISFAAPGTREMITRIYAVDRGLGTVWATRTASAWPGARGPGRRPKSRSGRGLPQSIRHEPQQPQRTRPASVRMPWPGERDASDLRVPGAGCRSAWYRPRHDAHRGDFGIFGKSRASAIAARVNKKGRGRAMGGSARPQLGRMVRRCSRLGGAAGFGGDSAALCGPYWCWMVERPARRPGEARRGPRPPRSTVGAGHQADTGQARCAGPGIWRERPGPRTRRAHGRFVTEAIKIAVLRSGGPDLIPF
jgi:hypothetical protein